MRITKTARSWAAQKLDALKTALAAAANPQHAQFHQAYHKSQLQFYGLRTPQFNTVFLSTFPRREAMSLGETLPLVEALWASDWAEERWLAILLLERLLPQLSPADLPLLRRIADGCDGWGVTDMFSLRVLGPLALLHGNAVYAVVRSWSGSPHLWTRRCSILIHVLPARRGRLADKYAWPTFEERLFEKEFFIRKAIGWALRECSKQYPQSVCDFLLRVGDRASGLTRREGGRNLPAALRIKVLGK